MAPRRPPGLRWDLFPVPARQPSRKPVKAAGGDSDRPQNRSENAWESRAKRVHKSDEFREGSLRGEVGLKWERAGAPSWGLTQTIRETVVSDEELEKGRRNPAPTFRKARVGADHEYVERWVRGCKFPWLR